ncbi:hypothetical protein [Burkholderia aenigmatica]|uniref:hypothetical protein n=1 Tax=Burkholderia aenigmatica TaxID=2015348 RepID=UPI0026524242|nr:hypothetical protein [Burkholderia aenigmatica]MDN7876578.1 hypothetical protein [Burkholderia aenigmatica]
MRKFYGVVPVAVAIALFVALSGCGKSGSDQGAGEIVTLEHVPEPVRTTIERQRQGGSVGVIQRRVKDDKSLYVVTIVQEGQQQRLILAEDGKIISSRPVGDDEEDYD